jgi:hypothetical protein
MQNPKAKLEQLGYTVDFLPYVGYQVSGRQTYVVTANHFLEEDAVKKALSLIEKAKGAKYKPVWMK